MCRYLALILAEFDVESLNQRKLMIDRIQRSDSAWTKGFESDCLLVLYRNNVGARSRLHLIGAKGGVVMGTLFNSDTAWAIHCSEYLEGLQIVDSGGRRLVDRYWGRYCAFINDERARYVLRDPCGGLPCYHAEIGRVKVLFSDLEDYVSLTREHVQIDWEYVAAHVVNGRVQSGRTAIKGIREVLPGECLKIIRDTESRQFYWNPFEVAGRDVIEDVRYATQELQRRTIAVVEAWAANHSSILVRLSGGLDSAIVLSSLSGVARSKDIACVNDYSTGSDTDERHYARACARTANVEIIERKRTLLAQLELNSGTRPRVNPHTCLDFIENHPSDAELAAQRMATAVFTGRGGDQIFYKSEGLWLGADYAYTHGPTLEFLRVAMRASYANCTARNSSIWTHLKHGYRYGLQRKQPGRPEQNVARGRRLVSREAIEMKGEDQQWLHPWFSTSCSAAPGKALQVRALAIPEAEIGIRSAGWEAEIIHPLLSQPLIEFCISVPTYILMHSNVDRSLARAAFKSSLPCEIVLRRTKGGVNEHIADVLRANMTIVRRFLREGILVKNGLLDQNAIDTALSEEHFGLHRGTVEIVDHLNTELWANLLTTAS